MKCVVPLAGPDLVHPAHGFRPLVPVEGVPLLERALRSRAWAGQLAGSDHVFVTRAVDDIERLEAWLADRWPGCRIVRLGSMTDGAMLSALAGIAALGGDDEVIAVDLADILFADGPADPQALFDAGVGAVIPVFESQEDCYSYLRSEGGRVVEAAEKRVISDAASAGVYFFRDRATYLRAAADALGQAERLTFKGIHFVCPMANCVIAQGLEVLAPGVADCRPVGKMFHKVDASET